MDKALSLLSVLALSLAACTTVPMTGRKQLNLIPESEMLAMSDQQYGEFLQGNKLSDNKEQTAMVKKVGRRIQKAVEQYFTEEGLADQLSNYEWEVNLVESEEVNAWCMPGGKIVVYTGILPVTQTEAGLAVVMGHEVAHAVAKHGSERMSEALLAQLGGMGLGLALEKYPQQTQQMWMTAYDVGATYGALLPFSRTQESEADHIGLILMARGGYDPHEALSFWQRMAEQASGPAPYEFLSTHPSDRTRIENIKKELPEAMKYYRRR